ncbi:hypothetical protein F5146DRAFT_1001386 [Armillaria mellea]|nr:hypothetical protein F5146DRAFT_1001386 [Armillaria mellea]
MSKKVVGILGGSGGQLGRMLAASASLLNIPVVILDVGESAPAKQVITHSGNLSHIDGSFTDPQKIRELASKVDVLTVEIEHIDVDALENLAAAATSGRLAIHPSPQAIRIIQDKFRRKEHLREHGVLVSAFREVRSSVDAITSASTELGLPLMLKSRTLAYDGRGNYVLRDISDAENVLAALGGRPLYAEKWVPVHQGNRCHGGTISGCRYPDLSSRAQKVAEAAVATLEGAGVFGVEMFLMEDGNIYVNEIAPRPHNSGHCTIEACETSQYENHLRSILSLPLGSTDLKVPSAAMLNSIGSSSSMSSITCITDVALTVPGASTHLYGKAECRKGRKMGHITIVVNSDASLCAKLRPLLEVTPGSTPKELEKYTPVPPSPGSGHSNKDPLVGVSMSSDSDLPVMLPAAMSGSGSIKFRGVGPSGRGNHIHFIPSSSLYNIPTGYWQNRSPASTKADVTAGADILFTGADSGLQRRLLALSTSRSFAVVPWLVHMAVKVLPNRRADCFGAELRRIGDVHQLGQDGLVFSILTSVAGLTEISNLYNVARFNFRFVFSCDASNSSAFGSTFDVGGVCAGDETELRSLRAGRDRKSYCSTSSQWKARDMALYWSRFCPVPATSQEMARWPVLLKAKASISHHINASWPTVPHTGSLLVSEKEVF